MAIPDSSIDEAGESRNLEGLGVIVFLQNVLLYFALFLVCSVTFAYLGFAVSVFFRGSERGEASTLPAFDLTLFEAGGMAVTGLVAFVAAACHLFYWQSIAGVLFLVAIAPIVRFGPGCLAVFVRALGGVAGPAGLILLGASILAIPSILPDTTSDGQAFHLVYAKEWADAHALTVDPFVREPLYAMNWLTLDGLFELIGLGWYSSLLVGLTYVWAAVGIYAAVVQFGMSSGDRDNHWLRGAVVGIAATLSFVAAPIAIRYGFTALIDVPIGYFFLVSVMAAASTFVSPTPRNWFMLCLLAGFFTGLKTSLFLFVPLWLALIICAKFLAGSSWRTIGLATIGYVVIASPWFLRNYLIAGDPIAPALNVAITGKDLFWDKADVAGQLSDIPSSAHTLAGFVRLPIDMVFNPGANEFRENGSPFAYLLLFAPLLALIVALLWRRKTPIFTSASGVFFACVTYAIIYFAVVSTLGRYALVFMPAFSAALALIFANLTLTRGHWYVAPAMLLALAIPGPSSYSWLPWNQQFVWSGLSETRADFLQQRLLGYSAAEFVAEKLKTAPPDKTIYEVGSGNLCLVLRREGHGCVGDWFGPSRFEDLGIAINSGRLSDYLQRFNIAAFVIRRSDGGGPISNLTAARLAAEAGAEQFQFFDDADKDYLVFVRTDSTALRNENHAQ